MMDRIDALKVFCTVVETGGFNKAAEKLGISTTSVTHQISTLESHFKIKLLNRTTRRMSVTEEGQICYENAQNILGELQALEHNLQNANAIPRGRLNVDMPAIISRLYVAPALAEFIDRYPDIMLRISANDKLIDMTEEAVDVMIRIGKLDNPNLVARTLCHTEYISCCSPAYLKKHGQPRHPDQLSDFACLSFLYPKTRQLRPWLFQQDEQHISYLPQGVIATEHVESLIAAAEADCGIIQVLSLSVQNALRQGSLVSVLDDWRIAGPDVNVLFQQKHLRAAKVKVFVDFLGELFKE